MKIETQSIHFTADEKLLALIEERLSKLEQFYDQILDAVVFLKLENNGKVQDKIVEIKLNVPKELLVAKGTSKKFEVSLDQVVEALRKQLIKYKGKVSAR
jgi:putative sigma-54 modulation protein